MPPLRPDSRFTPDVELSPISQSVQSNIQPQVDGQDVWTELEKMLDEPSSPRRLSTASNNTPTKKGSFDSLNDELVSVRDSDFFDRTCSPEGMAITPAGLEEERPASNLAWRLSDTESPDRTLPIFFAPVTPQSVSIATDPERAVQLAPHEIAGTEASLPVGQSVSNISDLPANAMHATSLPKPALPISTCNVAQTASTTTAGREGSMTADALPLCAADSRRLRPDILQPAAAQFAAPLALIVAPDAGGHATQFVHAVANTAPAQPAAASAPTHVVATAAAADANRLAVPFSPQVIAALSAGDCRVRMAADKART
jgi:hypothetical protein